MSNDGFDGYGVMLLALGILLVGVAVLTVARRRRARPPRTDRPED